MMQLQDLPLIMPINKKMPKYRQIASVLEEYLRCTKPAAGEKFFTDRMLAKHFSTTAVTIAHSLNYLCNKGILVRKIGSGTFVAGQATVNVKRRIGIICHEILRYDNYYVQPILSRFGNFFSELGYDVISFKAQPEDYRRLSNEYELSGVVIFVPKIEFTPAIKGLQADGVPIISIGYANPALPGIAFGTDHEKSIDMAVDYLYNLGHREICLINNMSAASSQVCLYGFQKAMWERGLPVHPNWHITLDGSLSSSKTEQLVCSLKSLQRVPTAMIVGMAHYSFDAYRAAQQLGLRIPEDLSIIGLGCGFALEELNPPLTLIAQNLDEIADNAAQSLLEKIVNGSNTENDTVCAIPPLLIERESCAKVHQLNKDTNL